ncbi:hypothetical protein ZIOFF_011592 [Zingiber officinale]|uniref:Cyanobacterial aminoacyl-tRNA synthetase CAAD domain-containing protein n=1 Tax=Zingiber officinale TaxID=94328 RepID=A0A8J5HND6_ZINOF|nr:hypothetical protein ZIOFF_011592 [Zingiber officinale]
MLSSTCPFLSGERRITIWKEPMNWKSNDGGEERASPVQDTDRVDRKKLYGGDGPRSVISSKCSQLASPSFRRSTGHPLPPPAAASPLLLVATAPSSLLPFTRSDPHAPFFIHDLNYSGQARPLSLLRVRASSSEDSSSVVGDDLLADLKEKWDALENKSTVLLYGGGALVALWLSSILVGAVNSVPLLPKIMELVGLGYTGWFVYRYLLFKESRKELANDIDVLKKKVAGTE